MPLSLNDLRAGLTERLKAEREQGGFMPTVYWSSGRDSWSQKREEGKAYTEVATGVFIPAADIPAGFSTAGPIETPKMFNPGLEVGPANLPSEAQIAGDELLADKVLALAQQNMIQTTNPQIAGELVRRAVASGQTLRPLGAAVPTGAAPPAGAAPAAPPPAAKPPAGAPPFQGQFGPDAVPDFFLQFYRDMGVDDAAIAGLWATFWTPPLEEVLDPISGKVITREVEGAPVQFNAQGQAAMGTIMGELQRRSDAAIERGDTQAWRQATLLLDQAKLVLQEQAQAGQLEAEAARLGLSREELELRRSQGESQLGFSREELAERQRQADIGAQLQARQLEQGRLQAEGQLSFAERQAQSENALQRYNAALTGQRQAMDIARSPADYMTYWALRGGQPPAYFNPPAQGQVQSLPGRFPYDTSLFQPTPESVFRAREPMFAALNVPTFGGGGGTVGGGGGTMPVQGAGGVSQNVFNTPGAAFGTASPDLAAWLVANPGASRALASGSRALQDTAVGRPIPPVEPPPGETFPVKGASTFSGPLWRTQNETQEQAPLFGGGTSGYPRFLSEAMGRREATPRRSIPALTGLPFVSGQTFGTWSPSEREGYLSSFELLGAPRQDVLEDFYKLTRGFGSVPTFRYSGAQTRL